MGKIRTRTLGDEKVEDKQKKAQKEKSLLKKVAKKEEVGEVVVEAKKPVKKQIVEKKSNGRGKKYLAAKSQVDKKKLYKLAEAVELLKKMKYGKIDESFELHLNVLETGLKGEVEFPNSTGKTIRVAIVSDAVLLEIEKNKLDFDILVTHPSFMPKLAKFAKVLGPKGLMPNPKAGTISPNPEEVAKKFLKGNTRWKTEPKSPLIHQMIGKSSFEAKKLVENAEALLNSVQKKNITSGYIKTTFSPSVKIDLS